MCPAGSSDRGPRYQAAAELALRNILVRCRLACYTAPKCSRSPKLRHRGTAVTAGPRQLGTKAAGQAGSPRRAALVEPHAASTSLLSQRPAHPTHRPGRARPRGPSRRRPAAVGVRNGCPDLPAGCLRAACRCSAVCCWSSACQPCLLGACCSGLIPVRTLFSPAAFGGVWGCWRCRAWHWAVQKRVLWSDLNGRPVLSF